MHSNSIPEGSAIQTTAVRLVVDQHYLYRPEAPETFDWEQVINPKVAAIALDLVQEIHDRRYDWAAVGGKSEDPCIQGLQQALRIMARTAVWRVKSEQTVRANEAARTLTHAYPLPGTDDPGVPEVPLPHVRSDGV